MTDTVRLRRALLLTVSSSALVPLVGLATAPILAQALGVEGRGEVAAALAPAILLSSVAALGLPEALTFYVAQRPVVVRRALLGASAVTALLGAVSFLLVLGLAPFLSAGDPGLSRYIVLATAIGLPVLFVNLLRGAAAGRQLWGVITVERVIIAVLRLAALSLLAVTGHLTVFNAILVQSVIPILSGVVYWRLLRTGGAPDDAGVGAPATPGAGVLRSLVAYGARVWLGAVALMVLARLSQFLVAPLSDVEQLGLLVVAITIADVPFIFTGAVREVLFSAESAQGNPDRLAQVSRLTMLVSVLGSAVLAATLPLWIGPLFGRAFEAAVVPTWLTLLSQVISIPGVLAGVGLASSGRPGVRSAAQVIALFGNLVGLLALVPSLGALGAALAGIAGNVLATGFALVLVRRSLGMSVLDLVLPRGRDFAFLVGQVGGILRRAAYRRRS